MNKEVIKDVKMEPIKEPTTNIQVNGDSAECNKFDYNKLYGELYRKLLSTPVGEIFTEGTAPSTSGHVSPSSVGYQTMLQNPLHPAFPVFGSRDMMDDGNKHVQQNQNVLDHNTTKYNNNKRKECKMESGDNSIESSNMHSPLQGYSPVGNHKELQDIDAMQRIYAGLDHQFGFHETIDVTKLVEEFRVTLEKYGVSQRFAARFIMQDTSQGNLSFLMEKGRSKKWAELSPRGRIPYIKMKAWLESKDQQMKTLDMLKHSQDARRSSPRETYSRRERFSMFQLNVLCRLFEENPNPQMNVRNAVAERLNIPLDRVNVWFQNQRARGFPARKILQQSFYNEGPLTPKVELPTNGQYSPVEVKTRRGPSTDEMPSQRRSSPIGSGDPLNNISSMFVNSNDFHYLTKSAGNNVNEHPAFPIPHMQNKSPPGNAMPLDLRANKQTENNISTMQDSATVSSASRPIPEMTFENGSCNNYITPEPLTTSKQAFESEATEIRNQSGAAKRKRGIKPQHIIPNKGDDTIAKVSASSYEETDEYMTKRKKVDDVLNSTLNVSKDINGSDYRYTLATGEYSTAYLKDIKPNTEKSNEKQKISDWKSDDKRLSNQGDALEVKSEYSNVFDNNTRLGKDAALANAELEVFKSICANIFMSDKGTSLVEEPDLD